MSILRVESSFDHNGRMETVIVLTTVGAAFDARSLARALVDRRLVACVNIVPGIVSVYRWKDAVEEDGELLLVMKTTARNVDRLRTHLMTMHPYETPEFVVIGIDALDDGYREWLAGSVQ